VILPAASRWVEQQIIAKTKPMSFFNDMRVSLMIQYTGVRPEYSLGTAVTGP
jgi:hypothetical protein